MLESQINKILMKDSFTKKIFKNTLARDELPKTVKYPSCYVINTKPRSHEGEHWLAVFYDKNKIGYFFDSYGFNPSRYDLENFMNKTSEKWYYNKKRIHGLSTYCGYYCVLFILFKSRKLNFFSNFTSNYLLNDKKIYDLINLFKKNK